MTQKADKIRYLELMHEKIRRLSLRKFDSYYPETGKLSRHNYPKHMDFFTAGLKYSERCAMSANRIGKSEGIGAYEMTCHLTGEYPNWWPGIKFTEPIDAWACGTTGTTARDIVQFKLLGPKERIGTGVIPGRHIIRTTPKAGGVPEAIDSILVRHVSGGVSTCKIKAYAEGRKSFEGTEKHIIWLDEECPLNIYTECLIRTMTTAGHILFTFTPLEGLTETVLQFLPGGKIPKKFESSKIVITATWDDAPHLGEEEKQKLWDSLPPYQRDARSKGIPQIGSGAIYPVAESDIVVTPFMIPKWWPKCYAMDVGWKRTAALFGAMDLENDCLYLFYEYYMGKAEPVVHAAGIKAPGKWIPGAIDPASRGRSQDDGKRLFTSYCDLGLNLTMAKNAVESGIMNVWIRLSSGRMKVFSSCVNWLAEYRIYRRDEDGKVVKQNDHLMDCTKYMVSTGIDIAIVEPVDNLIDITPGSTSTAGGWAR